MQIVYMLARIIEQFILETCTYRFQACKISLVQYINMVWQENRIKSNVMAWWMEMNQTVIY